MKYETVQTLLDLFETKTRTVAGLMTGTSLDGVDVVIARLSGSGRGLSMEVLASESASYPRALHDLLLEQSDPRTSSVYHLSQLNFRLAHLYVDVIKGAIKTAGLDAVDLVGSHGQTVHHVPELEDCAGKSVRSTLQIGDPSVLANLLGVPVVGDFRVADMALGGQGAPLVPYFDYVAFSDENETRGLLNLGGIANLSVLPAGGSSEDLIAFDTGPANMLLDIIARRYFDAAYDRDGRFAREGVIHEGALEVLLEDDYFLRPPPKSTGREYFGEPFLETIIGTANSPSVTHADYMATAAALTARSVHDAYERFISDSHTLDVVIASGGGVRNPFLMEQLTAAFDPIPVRTADDYGVDSDLKEALCFAVLAHETINGAPSNVPSATGASRGALLGKICVPG